jgi:hypothetical protein
MHAPYYYKMPIKLLGLSTAVHTMLEQGEILTVGALLDRMSDGAIALLSIPTATPEALDEVLTQFIQFQEQLSQQRDWVGLDQQLNNEGCPTT